MVSRQCGGNRGSQVLLGLNLPKQAARGYPTRTGTTHTLAHNFTRRCKGATPPRKCSSRSGERRVPSPPACHCAAGQGGGLICPCRITASTIGFHPINQSSILCKGALGSWCNGSTGDFDSPCRGSSPCEPASGSISIGRVPALGAGCCRFKSCLPDHFG
jgi:hypothetical protein